MKPCLPPSRIEYHGLMCSFFGPADEFAAWKAEPMWRRLFGLTSWDKRNVRSRGNGRVPAGASIVCFHGQPRPWDVDISGITQKRKWWRFGK